MLTNIAPLETETLITGEELLAMGDPGPSELVEGRIVVMRPTALEHGGYELNFAEPLKVFVRHHKLGKVVVGEVGIYTHRNPDTVRAADVIFISHSQLAKRQARRGYLDVAPELVVEIMSPDDRWSEVNQKLREYFTIGVKLVLVADPADRSVYVYRSLTDVREFTGTDTLTGDDVLPGFSIPVASLFEE